MTSAVRTGRSLRQVLAASAVAIALVTSAWSVLGVVAVDDAAAQGCGPAPAGQVAVAVVVDGTRGPSQRCVVVPERTDGFGVLRAAGFDLRIDGGFLCAIDGVPATGCAKNFPFDGSYWRYYHASPGGPWVYSTVGAGVYRMPSRCAIEGWRWTTPESTDLEPRVSRPPITCETPPTVAPTVAPTLPRPVEPAPVTPAAPGGAAPSPVPGAGDPAAPVTSVPAADTTAPPAAEVDPATEESVVEDPPSTPAEDERAAGGSERPAAGSRAAADAADGGSPVGLVLAALLVAALAGGAVWRRRRAVEVEESPEGP